jgi:hypothetical protein
MAKTSRLNPNKASRSALKQLQKKHLLHRQKVGLRHVIKTDGTVHYVGYDVGYDWYNRHMPNFYPGLEQTYRSVVHYNGERAELTAALGRKGWEGHILDVGTHFEPNPLATQLLATRPNNTWQLLNFPIAYGDAVLVTDNRMHWFFGSHKIAVEDLETFNNALTTPRDLIKDARRAHIFFHTEPNQQDIFTLMMHWL